MTIFHLIRHAAHGQLGHFLTGRTAGVDLSDIGRAQAEALAARISRIPFDEIYSSPQLRAVETATPVAAAMGLDCRISPNLDEIDFGSWSGQPFKALEDDPAWKHWNDDRDNARTPGGETMSDVAIRVIELLDDLRRKFPSGRVVLVSHSDVIKAVICHYRGWMFQSVHSFQIAPASVTTIEIDGRAGDVLSLNETEDLSLEAVA